MADDRTKMFLLAAFASCIFTVQGGFTPLVGEVICGATGFETSNLTSRTWTFSVPKVSCLKPKTVNSTVPDDGCKISIGFCPGPGHELPGNCSGASVCEEYTKDKSTYKLATRGENQQPFNTTAPSLQGEGFHVSYLPGENYTTSQNTSCQLQTMMTFICNSSAVWTLNTDMTQPVPVTPIIEYDALKCVFAGACPMIQPGPQPKMLSAGSVLLLIFFVSLILYFVLGCFVNIARGKMGQEIIPHHSFWTMLPVYIMDGIQFTLSCGKREAGKTYESI